MANQGEQYENSWFLYDVLDRFIGSREVVAARRRMTVLMEHFDNQETTCLQEFNTGSVAEGVVMQGSDVDMMLHDKAVIVLCQYPDTSFQSDYKDKTVLVMRDADSRPGYVTLELVQLGERVHEHVIESIIPDRDAYFISSEIYTRCDQDSMSGHFQLPTEIHGPACTMEYEHNNLNVDYVKSFRCYRWPKEAGEWVTRPRLHNWPDQALRDQIVQGGCHLVPVGDKTSADTFLQWRISFTTAERKLMYSLTHVQFLVYGLLKYFLKQISDMLKQLAGYIDIISSYIIKTVIFHTVENTPGLLWQEKHTFLCFILCLNILITWVKTGYCPNYFIKGNNMFLGNVHGENQRKLLHFLVDLYDQKWGCLSVGTFIQPSIGELIDRVRNGDWEYVLPPSTRLELVCDEVVLVDTFSFVCKCSPKVLPASLSLLSKSQSDMDEFIPYTFMAMAVCHKGMEGFQKHNTARGNKEKYKSLRKSKKLLTPLSSMCTSPGELTLATYYYQTGNYSKALEICGNMISSFKIYVLDFHCTDKYEQRFCGRGYTLLQKCKAVCVSDIMFTQNALHFYPSQLHLEVEKCPLGVPPLPFALFLSFLCYHELGHARRRDTALDYLRAVKYDREQGGSKNWIVHNLLGICYEMVGDTQRAIGEYRDSLGSVSFHQYVNPAKERIQRLYQLETFGKQLAL
ncbi:uncharacterized protein LOC117337097 [Pecten maximus]|uniref:uncharacterized protein LOC117337097 n=1 Tax=Pecten maximus TaxID=6579 RepID=UPI0014590595|nr:uncharacterized protein LOC117337097 [Pecten maximus]